MKAMLFVCLIFLSVFILTGVALSKDEYVFQYGLKGYEETKDTHITEYSGNNTNNMGGNIENECCEYDPANSDGKSYLIWFDVSSISTSAVIGSATLEMYMTSTRNGTNEKEVAVHRLLKDWEEGKGTGIDGVAAQATEVCGKWTGKGEDWSVVGADGPEEDFIEEADDVIAIGGGINEWYYWDVTVMCQYWIKHPDENFGAILREPRPHAATLGTKVFASKENSDSDIHPALVIVVDSLSVDSMGKLTATWGGIRQ